YVTDQRILMPRGVIADKNPNFQQNYEKKYGAPKLAWDDIFTEMLRVSDDPRDFSFGVASDLIHRIDQDGNADGILAENSVEPQQQVQVTVQKPTESSSSGPSKSTTYPSLVTFAYALPGKLGTLEWVDEPQYYTEHGWMSKNLDLTKEQSAELGSKSTVSIH